MTDLETLAKELIEKSEKATPGPWVKGGTGTVVCDVGGNSSYDIIALNDTTANPNQDFDNRDYIAACSPETIKKLAEALLSAIETVTESKRRHHNIVNICNNMHGKLAVIQDMAADAEMECGLWLAKYSGESK